MAVYLRYCPTCREEYQPHMVRCIECGSALRDMLEGEAPEYDPPEPPALEEPLLPAGDYRSIADSLSSSTVSTLMRHFVAAGIPIKVESHGYTLRLSAREEDVPAAMAILAREEVVPKQPDATEPAVATEGGPCPACGIAIRPGTGECPECGLRLAASAEPCERCGCEVAPDDQSCPACGQRLY